MEPTLRNDNDKKKHIASFSSQATETALVRVQNDILCAIDSNHSVILLLLA